MCYGRTSHANGCNSEVHNSTIIHHKECHINVKVYGYHYKTVSGSNIYKFLHLVAKERGREREREKKKKETLHYEIYIHENLLLR